MVGKAKRPQGRPPIGAIWLEDEGRYEYTQKYFDHREQSFLLSNRSERTIKETGTTIERRSTLFMETIKKKTH